MHGPGCLGVANCFNISLSFFSYASSSKFCPSFTHAVSNRACFGSKEPSEHKQHLDILRVAKDALRNPNWDRFRKRYDDVKERKGERATRLMRPHLSVLSAVSLDSTRLCGEGESNSRQKRLGPGSTQSNFFVRQSRTISALGQSFSKTKIQ